MGRRGKHCRRARRRSRTLKARSWRGLSTRPCPSLSAFSEAPAGAPTQGMTPALRPWPARTTMPRTPRATTQVGLGRTGCGGARRSCQLLLSAKDWSQGREFGLSKGCPQGQRGTADGPERLRVSGAQGLPAQALRGAVRAPKCCPGSGKRLAARLGFGHLRSLKSGRQDDRSGG